MGNKGTVGTGNTVPPYLVAHYLEHQQNTWIVFFSTLYSKQSVKSLTVVVSCRVLSSDAHIMKLSNFRPLTYLGKLLKNINNG